MFEGLVTALLNKFLGPYIKNLDSSQLKLSIFSGNVSLEDLEVKPDALADKNLPIRVHAGFLHELQLKIPWKSLYTEPTVVVIDGVYLIVGPTTGFKYDAETAKKEAREKKQKELEQIEEKKRIEREGKPEEKSDGFVEKMVTQIIKNLQVTVKNVHIRYEDEVTCPGSPFAIGVTLQEVFAKTVDSNWKEAVIKDSVQQIRKLVGIRNLAAYVETNAQCLAGLPLAEWKDGLTVRIRRNSKSPPDVLRPFSGEAKLMLNKNPGEDMNVPKMLLEIMLQQLRFTLTRSQFVDVMELVESFDRIALNAKFMKYKASGRPTNNARGWWKYCISAILNEQVRRRLQMWSWKHIHKHKRLLREYRDIYKSKLLEKSYSSKRLQELEDYLDVFNISLARGWAEMEVEREKVQKKKEKQQKGWFSGWFGGGKANQKGTTKTTIAGEKVEITAEEKAKLYEAIGYVEDALIAELPREYVDNKISVQLTQLAADLVGEDGREIVHASLNENIVFVETRTSAKNVCVKASSSGMTVLGIAEDGEAPELLKKMQGDKAEKEKPLFSVCFENNPLDGKCNQRIVVELQPAEITADMLTVNVIIPFFSLPKDVHLQQLQSAATEQLQSLREQGRAAIQHAIGRRKVVDVNVTVHSSYVLVPETGRRTDTCDLLVVDLGSFSLKSQFQEELPSLEDATVEELDEHAYDRFNLKVTDVQVIFASREDDWHKARKEGPGQLHLLQPVTLDVVLMKSVVPDDTRLPKVKLSGDLPLLQITVSDRKIERLIELVLSLPLPESASSPATLEVVANQEPVELPTLSELGLSTDDFDAISLSSISTETSDQLEYQLDITDGEEHRQMGDTKGFKLKPQALKFAADLKIQKIGLTVSRWQTDKETALLDASVMDISTEVKVQTWDIMVTAGLQMVTIQDTSVDGKFLTLVQGGSQEEKLVSVSFLKANTEAPGFDEEYNSTLHKLTAEVSNVEFVVQDRSLLQLKEFALGLASKLNRTDHVKEESDNQRSQAVVQTEVKPVDLGLSKARTQFQLQANLKRVAINLCSPEIDIANVSVKDVATDIAVGKDVTTVSASLNDVVVLDCKETKYQKIISITKGEDALLRADISVYNDGSKDERYADLNNVDVDVHLKVAPLRVVFLNAFVQKLLDFGEKFKPSEAVVAKAKQRMHDAAEAAKASLKENSGARIKLDITANGPVIVIPRNDMSDERLEADLGKLIVSNCFKYANDLLKEKDLPTDDVVDNPDFPAVVDCMTVQLMKLKLTRFSTVELQCHVLLVPMDFEVLLNRCITESYRGLPMIDVTGSLPPLKLQVGKLDIDFSLAFLEENLKAGEKKNVETKITESAAAPRTRPASSSQLPASEADGKVQLETDVDFDWTKIRAAFDMPEVSLSLLDQAEGKEQTVRLELSITALDASVSMKGPCLEVSASVKDAIIRDCEVKNADGSPLLVLFSEQGVNLLDFKLQKVDSMSRLFKTEFGGVENKISADIAAVEVVVHRQSVLGLIEFALSLKPTTAPAVQATALPKRASVSQLQTIVPEVAKIDGDHVKVFLNASLKKIGVTLKSKEANIASMAITTAKTTVHLNSDGTLETKLTVSSFLVDDIREKQHGITHLIEKYSESKEPMLDVSYSKNSFEEHVVDGSLNNLNVAVCVDFVLSLLNFVQSVLPKEDKTKQERVFEKPSKHADKHRFEEEPEPTAKLPVVANVTFKMDTMHVFLLENSFDVHTRALYFTASVDAMFKQTGDSKKVFASLPSLALHSCIYSEKTQPRAEIISPFDVQLTYTDNSDIMKKNATIKISSINVSVDPYTISMMKHVADTASKALQMTVSTILELEVAYYNETLAVWEPLIEPVPQFENEFTYRRWRLKLDVQRKVPQKAEEETLAAQFDVSMGVTTEQNIDEDEPDGTVNTNQRGTSEAAHRMSIAEIEVPEALLSLNIASEDVLQVTVSKTALQVFTALVEDWSDADSAVGQLAKHRQVPPYDVHNKTGITVKVWPGPAFKDPSNGSGIILSANQTVPLSFVQDTRGNTEILSETFNADQVGHRRGGDCVIAVEVNGFKTITRVPVLEAALHRYVLQPADSTAKDVSLVCEIEALEGHKIIRFRSPLQVKNKLAVAAEIQMVHVGADKKQSVSVAELVPEETFYPNLLGTGSCAFMLKPPGPSHNVSQTFTWKDKKKNLTCKAADNSKFGVRLVVTKDRYESVVPEGMSLDDVPRHTLHLCPPVVVHNLLPVPITFSLENSTALGGLEGGQKTTIFDIDLNEKPLLHIMATDCGGHDWIGEVKVDLDSSGLSFFAVKTKAMEGQFVSLQLGVQTVADMSVHLYLFCPYWMVNKTFLPLQYKPNEVKHIIEHEPSCSGAVMLAFDKTSGSKKTAQLRISNSKWSKPFSLDIAGSGGVVKCMLDNKEYEVGVKVNLTSFSLTRTVSFTPYQLISNNTPYTIYCFEGPSSHPLRVDSEQCCPLWPDGKTGDLQIAVGSSDAPRSQPFKFTEVHSTLLQLNGEVAALNVEVQVSDSAIVIAFSQYYNGAAPIRIENSCMDERVTVEFWQKSQDAPDKHFSIKSQQSRLFTWSNPLGKRVLCWRFGDTSTATDIYENNLLQDNHGKIELSQPSSSDKNPVKIYWASFLDGLQRVLLFTNDKRVVEKATETEHVERPDLEISFALQGVGIALVNNYRGVTAAYIGITSSGYQWESKPEKKKRWEPESYEMCHKLEVLYRDRSKMKETNLKVDFSDLQNMKLTAPKKRDLRRTFHEGIYCQFTKSKHHLHVHAVVNRMQIDNQVLHNVFSTIFHPVKPPKSVAAQAAPKPFLEASVVIHRMPESSVRQIKYFMILVQEISVQVDMGFITNIIQVFAPEKSNDKREFIGYKKDQDRVSSSLSQSSAVEAAAKGQKMFIDFFHLSPVKVHVSFSMDAFGTGEDDASSSLAPVQFVTTVLKSIGVVLTDVQDIELRLSYYEVSSKSMNDKQLQKSIQKHYTSQALKQFYALVLGLDVIGNPFGLVNKVKDGVFDLFYEPYQGAVQGPQEFAIGFAFGVRSLVSHTVGGLFGAVSRITGTLGKGIAKLTFDDKYQKDLATSKQPKNVGEGLVKGTKGFFGGLLHGVTGVVTKPFEGAKKEGVEGFFKGVGKGVIGLVARPVGGVVELASSTFQGISNAVDLDAEVVRLRFPRFINPNKVVHPYNLHTATGNFFLQVIDNGEFSESDVYFAHSDILDNPKLVIIVTNKRVILMEEGDMDFIDKGELKSPWSTKLREISEVREFMSGKGPAIQFILKTYKTGIFNKKSKENETKAFKAPNKDSRQYVIRKVQEALDWFSYPSQQ
ncbi:intermembrane lipid transfer protein VPS13C-like isoform X4 [Corticium candelabrum]|uniref:intermembrane lipid transfer protein VPS13C-like isoform X4 n=1 Tax=Corticium candelabrum TaxID=121492 RepID=UPI002E26FCF4|nr:intermembrane lipid transfer protein VPS13C-like isoform X4 [Corticium candelabrum]